MRIDHSREIVESFNPIRIFLRTLGLLPFAIHEKEDKTFSYRFNARHISTIIFCIVTVFNSILYALISCGILATIVDFKHGTYEIEVKNPLGKPENMAWEDAMFGDNIVIIINFWSWHTMAFIGSLYILTSGPEYVHYFNYWSKAVQIIDINVTRGVHVYVRKELIAFGLVVFILIFLFTFLPSVRVSCGTLACLLFRFFISNLAEQSWFLFAQILAFLIVIFGYAGSRAFIIQFEYFTKILCNAVRVWNNRFINTLQGGKKLLYVETAESRRLTYSLLLKDHLIIVQLFKMTEDTFALIIQSHYFMLIVCIMAEVIRLYMLLGPDKFMSEEIQLVNISISTPKITPTPTPKTPEEVFDEWQRFNTVVMIIVLLIQTSTYCYQTSATANEAHVEAMRGFQILRKHGFMNCNNSTEKNLMYTLLVSYSKNNPVDITTGYFAVNKALLVSMMGTVCAYFIILIQLPWERYPLLHLEDLRLQWGPPTHFNVTTR